MGKKVESYPLTSEDEIHKWSGFVKALVHDEVNSHSHSDLYKMFISKDAIKPA